MADDQDKLGGWPLEGLKKDGALRYWHGDHVVNEHESATFWKTSDRPSIVTPEGTRYLEPGPCGRWVSDAEHRQLSKEWWRDHAARKRALWAPIERLLALEQLRERNGRIYAMPVAVIQPPPDDDNARPDLFRTGAPGRPTAMGLILAEAKRRIADTSVPLPKHKTTFAQALYDWWEVTRKTYNPHGPETTKKTISNQVAGIWRGLPKI